MRSTTRRYQWKCESCGRAASATVWATVDYAADPETLSAGSLVADCPECGAPAHLAPPVLVGNFAEGAPLVWFGDGDDQAVRTSLLAAFGPMAAWAGTVVTVPRDRLMHGLSNQEISADHRQLRLEEGLRALFSITSEDDIVALVDHWPELRTAEARLLEQQCQQRLECWHPTAILNARTAALDSLARDDAADAWDKFHTILDDFIETRIGKLDQLQAEIIALQSNPGAWPDLLIEKHGEAVQVAAEGRMISAEADHRRAIGELTLACRGDMDEAITQFELAIALYERCGQFGDSSRWRVNLALTFLQRGMLEDGKRNADAAMHQLETALQFFDEFETPDEWANAQTNLAYALLHRNGDTEADALRAVEACQGALRVRSASKNRIDFVYTQINLGGAYTRLTRKDDLCIQPAVDAFQAAIGHIEPTAEPHLWTQAHHDLAELYQQLAKKQPEPYADLAEHHAREVLVYRDRDTDPVAWGFACRMLGEIARVREGDAVALTWYEQALEVLTPEAAPYDCAPLASAIGGIYADTGNWSAAADVYQVAVAAAQRIPARERHPDAIPGPTVWRWACYLQVRAALAGDDAEQRLVLAVETIERGRARELRATMPEQPDHTTIAGIHRAVEPGTCMVYLVASPIGSCALVVSRGDIVVVDAAQLTSTRLISLIYGFDLAKAEALEASYLFGLDGDDEQFTRALHGVLDEVGPQLMEPVAAKVDWAKQVTLVPCGPLGLLPLHAAPWPGGNGEQVCLLDLRPVAYAPSAFMLGQARQRTDAASGATPVLIGIGDPSGPVPLPGARAEMSEIAVLFTGRVEIRYGPDATKEFLLSALGSATHLHLACHGSARLGYPLESTLHLADGAELALAEVLADIDLDVRLVVTAACHSGSFDIVHDPDEVLGLPSGLLAAGAGGVVAALWAVDDTATALLMTRFYELMAAGDDPGPALRGAARWLRNLTRKTRRAFMKQHPNLRRELRRSGQRPASGRRPYQSAEFWAPFVLFGR